MSEAFGYDAMSRLITWSTSGSSPAARTFTYDGGGRLRRVVKTGTGATTERYHYDVDDQVPWEERVVGATTTHVWRHEGWEKRGTSWASGVVTEEVLPMAALRGTTLLVRLQELDGHAYQTWNSTTGAVTQEVLGAFAQRLYKYQSSPDSWVIDGFHGEEVNRSGDVIHKGARHLVLRDGMWMQPDVQGPPLRGGPARRGESRTGVPVRTVRPLLYLGLTNGDLRSPIGYTGVYAAGDTNALLDLNGLEPFALEATSRGAQRLDMTAQLASTVQAIVAATKDHQESGGSDKTEFGAILNWGGEGGGIQVGGAVQEAGEGGGKVTGEGGAGTIHMHPIGVDVQGGPSMGEKLNGHATDESTTRDRASSSGAAVSIVVNADQSVSMLTAVKGADGTTTTYNYNLDTASNQFVGGAIPKAPTMHDVKGTSPSSRMPPSKPPPEHE